MPKSVRFAPPPSNSKDLNSREWRDWFTSIYQRVGEGPLLLQGYSVAALPDVAKYGFSGSTNPFSSLIFIYDEIGGPTLAFSDGTNWRRVQDRAIVS
jgi:hypothetical protein